VSQHVRVCVPVSLIPCLGLYLWLTEFFDSLNTCRYLFPLSTICIDIAKGRRTKVKLLTSIMQSQTMAVNYEGVQRLDIRDHQKLVQKLAKQVFYIRIEQVKIGWYYVWQPLSSYVKKEPRQKQIKYT